MSDNSVFLIDIDKILKDKAGNKARRVPRFVVSYLKRIVHQDEINSFLFKSTLSGYNTSVVLIKNFSQKHNGKTM